MFASAIGVLGGIASSLFSNSQSNKQLKLQQQENQKNRDFNALQAKLAREYNTQMVNNQRAYDSPSALMQRLQEAGIHPALAYSNGMPMGDIGIGSTSMQANSAGAVGTGLPDFSSLSNIGQTLSNIGLQSSQSDLNNSVRSLNEKQLYWYDKVTENNLQVGNSVVRLNFATADLKGEEKIVASKTAAKLDEELNYVVEGCNVLKAEGRLKNAQALISEIDATLEDAKVRSEITATLARARADGAAATLSYAQATEIYKLIQYKQLAYMAKAESDYSASRAYDAEAAKSYAYLEEEFPQVVRGLKLSNDGSEIDLSFREFGNYADAVSESLGVFAGAAFTVMGLKGLKTPRKIGFKLPK